MPGDHRGFDQGTRKPQVPRSFRSTFNENLFSPAQLGNGLVIQPRRLGKKYNLQVDNYTPHDASTHSAILQTGFTPHAAKELFPGAIRFSGRLLITEGICLGTVDYVSAPIHQEGIVTRVATVSRMLEDIYGNAFSSKYVNGQAITHAFVNTLLVNLDDRVTTEYGMSIDGENGWTLMHTSFIGTLALGKVCKQIEEEFHESWHKLIMTKAISYLNAGLFLAAARSLINNRFFTTENGLMGLGNIDLKQGDSVVMLKGAGAAFVLRRRVKDRGDWMIVGDAYVHAVMEVNPDVYMEPPAELMGAVSDKLGLDDRQPPVDSTSSLCGHENRKWPSASQCVC